MVVRPSSDSQNNSNSDDDGQKKLDRTGMLTRGLAGPYCGLGTMVRERGLPANFC
jgi:hypothetical protein